MNTSQLAERLAERLGLTEKAARAGLAAAIDEIERSLERGESVTLSGFGRFELRERAERLGVHPGTGERSMRPAGRSVGFRAGSELRRRIVP